MNFASWSIRNPIPVVVLFALLLWAGLLGYRELGIQDFPDLDLPTVNVALRLPGAAPLQLETDVARKVEDSLASVQGVHHVYTHIRDGEVSITVEFELERPLTDALADVKDAVDRVRGTLPSDLEPAAISKVTVGPGGPIASYAVTSNLLDEEALSWLVDDEVARAVQAVPGVGEFHRVGGGQREIQVDVDLPKLTALGLTVNDVSHALGRFQLDVTSGRVQLGGSEQSVRTAAAVTQPAGLAALPLSLDAQHWVRLDEVAQVRDTLADRTTAAMLDGRPAVGFQILRSKGHDVTQIAAGVEEALARVHAKHPDVVFRCVSTTVPHTQAQFRDSMRMLYEGAILAVIVVWLFLREPRATLVGAAALPLSVLPAFAVMAWSGFTLNGLTMLALSVVVGILVDDAIVEVENIERHLHQGLPVRAATMAAVQEIALPVIATTLALVVVFLPTALMHGVPGLVFRQFGWTAVAAILMSLLVARLATPVMAVVLLRALPPRAPHDGAVMRWYLVAARWCLRHRALTTCAALLFFAAALAAVPLLQKGFIPPEDRGFTSIELETPPGSSLQTTLQVAEEARRAIQTGPNPVPGVASVFTTVGSASAPGAGEVLKGTLTLTFTPPGDRPDQTRIEQAIRTRLEAVPGARFSLGNGGPGEKLQLFLTGRDIPALKASALGIERALKGLGYLSGITSSATFERPELIVRPLPQQAGERGVTAQAISETIRIATNGDYTPALAKLKLDNRQVAIRVRVPEAARHDPAILRELRVPARNGLVPLSEVAQIDLQSGPSQLDRFDRSRFVAITADLGGHSLGDAVQQVMSLPVVRDLPSDVRVVGSGDAEFMADLFHGFGMAMTIGVIAVYCVLTLLFRNFLQAFTILSAVPLSLGGAVIGLFACRGELGLPALIGLVMLLGIVTKNSILLVEHAISGIGQRGLARDVAILEACRKRARPIVMTTVAMVAGMLPLALGLDGGNHFRQTMAVAVIGGLLSSTVLSLLVVPAVFSLVADLERLLGAGASGWRAGTPAAEAD